jgi:chromosome segregation ATPase
MKANKIALVLIAMFIVSIPAAFAEDNGTDINVNVGDTVKVNVGTGQVLKGARAEISTSLKNLREKVAELRTVRAEVRSEIAQSRVTLATARENLLKNKDKLKDCKNTNTTECDDLRVEIKLNAQETLLSTADHILDVLAKLKEQVQANEQISAEDKDKMVSDIDAKMKEVQDARDKIAALDENSDKSDIQDATQAIREAWKDSRASIKARAAQLAWGEMKAVTDAVMRMSEKLDTTIANYKAKGVDVSSTETLKTTFDSQLEAANTHLTAAKDAYLGITVDNVDAKAKTVRDELQAARTSLKEAHVTLKEITKNLRDASKAAKQEKVAAKNAVKEQNSKESKNETGSETPTNETAD